MYHRLVEWFSIRPKFMIPSHLRSYNFIFLRPLWTEAKAMMKLSLGLTTLAKFRWFLWMILHNNFLLFGGTIFSLLFEKQKNFHSISAKTLWTFMIFDVTRQRWKIKEYRNCCFLQWALFMSWMGLKYFFDTKFAF